MTEHDLLEVVDIEERSGLSRWGWAAYYAELQGENRDLMLIARTTTPEADFKGIAGYVVARETAGELHINNVAVREEFRRRGLGSDLLCRIVEKGKERGARTAFLEVRFGNTAARALYEKWGFKDIARRPNYYSKPLEDAVVMSLGLDLDKSLG
jgi:[ribosomal protein S18]-alanine N-acetyltransferase